MPLPRADTAWDTSGAKPLPSWYQAIREVYNRSDAGVQATIAELATLLGSPDGSVANVPAPLSGAAVNGYNGIDVAGSLASGVLNLAFDGTTSNVPEGTNLYYTDARADARVALAVPALTFNRMDASGDIRVDGNGDLRITS